MKRCLIPAQLRAAVKLGTERRVWGLMVAKCLKRMKPNTESGGQGEEEEKEKEKEKRRKKKEKEGKKKKKREKKEKKG